MAKRLTTPPATKPSAPATPTQFVAVRTKGLQLVQTLAPSSFLAIRSIDSEEGYLQIDAKLASIRNGKAQWKLAMQPITGPLDLAIQKQKEALAAAKDAAKGAQQLDAEVCEQFDKLEQHAKALLKDFNERKLLAAKQEAQERADEEERLRQLARSKAMQAMAAKTPQLRARLEQQRAELEAKAEEVAETPVEVAPAKGASSVARVQKMVRISDPIAFLRAVVDYEPTMGVYRTGVPPLRCTDKKGEEALLVEIINARLQDLYREQPGVVTSWPGVEEFDNITIAGK